MRYLRAPLSGYIVAVAVPVGTMLLGTYVGMPAFVFEHLIILVVVGLAVAWGMRPAVAAALAAAMGDNILLTDPTGRPTITGVRDVLDLIMFVAVAVTVGWLVASARRDRARAEAAVESERRAHAERDRLIAMVSHDLATPLAVIRAAVQVARLSQSRGAIDMEGLWDRLDTASARATSLVRTLTDARTLGAGELTLNVRELDVRELIVPVVQMMDRTSERHPIALTVPQEPVIVNCDGERLARVVENLVSNAIKYSPDGGPIEVSVVREGGEALLIVQDDGMGVSADAAPHLFEHGYRAREAAAVAPGLGLGLSIAAEIVKSHRGAIEARNRQPSGTIVTVRLPLARRYTTAPSAGMHNAVDVA